MKLKFIIDEMILSKEKYRFLLNGIAKSKQRR